MYALTPQRPNPVTAVCMDECFMHARSYLTACSHNIAASRNLLRRVRHAPARLGSIGLASLASQSPSRPQAEAVLSQPQHILPMYSPAAVTPQASQQSGPQLLPLAYYADSPAAASPINVLQGFNTAPLVESPHPAASNALLSNLPPAASQDGSSIAASHSGNSIDRNSDDSLMSPAAGQTLIRLGESPQQPGQAPASSLAAQLAQRGVSLTRGARAAKVMTPARGSSPNPFQPHANKPTADAVLRTPSRFGLGALLQLSASGSATAVCRSLSNVKDTSLPSLNTRGCVDVQPGPF